MIRENIEDFWMRSVEIRPDEGRPVIAITACGRQVYAV